MKSYLIYLDAPLSVERRDRSCKELEGFEYEKIKGFKHYIGNTGCTKAHIEIAKRSYRTKEEHTLVFEDDIKILDRAKFKKQIELALDNKDWDVYWFSFHPPKVKHHFKIVGELDHHYQIVGMLGTHCVIYRQRAIKAILQNSDSLGYICGTVNVDIAMRDTLDLRYYCPKEMATSFYDGPSTRVIKDTFWQNVDEQLLTGFEKEVQEWQQNKKSSKI